MSRGDRYVMTRPAARNDTALRFFHALGFDALGQLELIVDCGPGKSSGGGMGRASPTGASVSEAGYQPAGGITYTRASSGPNVSEKPLSSDATAGPLPPSTVAERPLIPSTSIRAVTVVELVFTAIT